jgi:2-dehydro-3-deoxy-D-arabinonate dehydratase
LLGGGTDVRVFDHDDPLQAIADGTEPSAVIDGSDIRLLAPIRAPEVWCAGVTYARSRDARLDEAQSEARDVYALVYEAERPELFLKDSEMRRTVGPGEPLGLRSDSRWMVPEPELGVVLGSSGRPIAVTIGNDVSSRDIEGENPLYLPQAKIFARACAIGPVLTVPDDWGATFEIRLRIWDREGVELFNGNTSTASMRRSPLELAEWLVRDNPVPPGSVLLTGTGLVPPDGYTMEPGHTVSIEISGIGELTNPVGESGAE